MVTNPVDQIAYAGIGLAPRRFSDCGHLIQQGALGGDLTRLTVASSGACSGLNGCLGFVGLVVLRLLRAVVVGVGRLGEKVECPVGRRSGLLRGSFARPQPLHRLAVYFEGAGKGFDRGE